MNKLSKILYLIAALSLGSFFIVWVILRSFAPFMWVAMGLVIVCVATAIWLDRRVLTDFLGAKTTKSGLSMGAMILMALVLLVAVNFLGARKYKTFDFSSTQVNSLSPQSIKVVQDLKAQMRVIYFYKKESETSEERKRAFLDLLRKYQDVSSQIQLEFVDMNSRPDLTSQFNVISGNETVWVEYQGRKNKMEKIDEQELTSAIIKLTREKEKVVYFTVGHGEPQFESSSDGQSLAALKQLLEGNRYSVRTHNFSEKLAIPEDADLLWILGPRQTFLGPEVQSIEEYLRRGGQVVMALDPKSSHNLNPLLLPTGLKLQDNVVATAIELGGQVGIDPRAVRGNVFGTHAITKPFGQNQSTIFALPQSLEKTTAVQGLAVEDLIRTTAQAMAFPDSKVFQSQTASMKDGKKGPFLLAAVVKGTWPNAVIKNGAKDEPVANGARKESTLVVFGGSTLFTDALLYGSLNRDLALNTVSFLAKEENLISITPKDVSRTQLEMTRTQVALFIFGLIIPVPILLFALSGFMWWRRRNA